MRFEAFTCQVLCGGKRLEEHKIEYDVAARTAKCYIESEEGKAFALRWTEDLYERTEGTQVLGRSQQGLVLVNQPEVTFTGRRISPTSERPFVFARIETSDREEDQPSAPLPVGFGTVKLVVNRGTQGARIYNPNWTDTQTGTANLHELSVKKLKVTQRATLGAAIATAASSQVSWNYIDPPSRPFVTFVFVYRSTSMLQALGVIEYVPEPSPVRANARAGPSRAVGKRPAQEIIDISDDSDDDDPEVKKAMKQLAEARKRAKGKHAAVDKKPKLENGEIIEL